MQSISPRLHRGFSQLAVGFADTEAECAAEGRGNADALVSVMRERGEVPPLAEEPERTNQINVRLADYEKAAAETLAGCNAAGSRVEHVYGAEHHRSPY